MNEIHTSGLDLDLLLVLRELLRTRSTTEAARRLGRTQSAVSHALARLRDAVGDPLFVRAGRALLPTPRAEAMARPAERLLVDAAALLKPDGAAFDPARLERAFVIAGTDFSDAVILPRLVSRLRREAPGVELRTRFLADDVDRAIQAREVDLAFGTRFRELAGLIEQPLYDERLTVVLREGHRAARGRLTLARYCALEHALVTPRGLPGSLVDDELAKAGKRRAVVLRLSSFAAAAMVVAETDLVVTLPEGFARTIARALPIVLRPLPVPLPPFRFSMAFGVQLRDDPAHAWLRRRALEAARAGRTPPRAPGAGPKKS